MTLLDAPIRFVHTAPPKKTWEFIKKKCSKCGHTMMIVRDHATKKKRKACINCNPEILDKPINGG